MNNERREYVSIYCKIYAEGFSNEIIDTYATGTEVYNFLMRDSGHTFDKVGNSIPGDSNIWYLGCNEKFGEIQYKGFCIEWGHGDSSFVNVTAFVEAMFNDNFITKEQHNNLIEKIKEGMLIDNMYDIGDYLVTKHSGKKWKKTKESETFRSHFKELLSTVKESMSEQGFNNY